MSFLFINCRASKIWSETFMFGSLAICNSSNISIPTSIPFLFTSKSKSVCKSFFIPPTSSLISFAKSSLKFLSSGCISFLACSKVVVVSIIEDSPFAKDSASIFCTSCCVFLAADLLPTPPRVPPIVLPATAPIAAALAVCPKSKFSCSPAVILADCLSALSAAVYADASKAPIFAPCLTPALVASLTPSFIANLVACAPAVAAPKVPIPR